MKRYIYAMAFPRSVVLDKAKSLAVTLNNHIIKCVVYRNVLPVYLDHWVEEVGIYLFTVNKIKSKVNLKPKDYLNSLFADCGNEKDDAEANLRLFKLKNLESKEYPDFEITDKLSESLFKRYTNLITAAMPILTSSKVLTINEWVQIADKALKQ